MNACNYNIGHRFQNIHTFEIIEVVELEDRNYFEGWKTGDIFESVDEDNFNDLQYYEEMI